MSRRQGIFLFVAALSSVGAAGAAELSHSEWTRVLERFVDEDGLVDYQGLGEDRALFDQYLEWIRDVSPDSHPEQFPTEDDELAYWINAYNAHVFAGVLDRGPEQKSVWSGGLISGRAFFVKRDIVVGGETMNLKGLEDDIVRGRYEDPRIHAAVNCASISCPRLPREAFVGDRLQEQLDAAMTEFVGKESNVEVDDGEETVRLSKIFDWFEKDFLSYEKALGSDDPQLLDYVNRYRAGDRKVPAGYDVEFFEYDKGINAQ